MPVYRSTIIWGAPDVGWSETYYFDVATHLAAATALDAIATLRLAMCKSDVTIKVLRVSDVAIKGDSFLKAATGGVGTYVPAAGVQTFSLDVAFQVNAYSGDHTAWTHWFLRGFCDDIVDTQDGFKLAAAAPAGWIAARDAYLAALVGAGAPKLWTKKPNPPGTKNAVAIASTGFESQLPIRRAGRPFKLHRGRRVVV
jgi:hypothetical protein